MFSVLTLSVIFSPCATLGQKRPGVNRYCEHKRCYACIRFSKLSKAASVAIVSLKNAVGFIIILKGFLFFLPREMNPNS